MILVADDKGRLASREFFTPKQAFNVSKESDGSIRVVELEEKPLRPANVRFVKENGYTVGISDRTVSLETIKELLAEFP